MSMFKQMRRVALAAVALGAIGTAGTAYAQTESGVTISNTVTVNYSVNTIAQTPVTASTSFVVDTVINVNVTGGNVTGVTPGQTGAAAVFTVTNASNIASNFNLVPTNQAGDNFDAANIAVRVDVDGNGVYDSATDNVSSITNLALGGSVTVFVVGDIPISATNGQTSLVRLEATAIDPGTGAAWVNDNTADQQNTVQIVVANISDLDDSTFQVNTAQLGVSKSSSVVRDPFNGTTNPKAIPGAVMEYTITIANSGATAATLQSISDAIPANTAFVAGDYAGSTDVSIQVDAAPATFCVAEAGGTDSNGDGCVRTAGGALSVGAPAITSIAAGSTVVVQFRVSID